MRFAHLGASTLAAIAALLFAAAVWAAEPALVLEGKVPLGKVSGRIDHLAVDLQRQRLFVAELGNDTVGVVDLKAMTTPRTLNGFREPQGIGYVRSTDEVYVANAGDVSVRILGGEDLALRGWLELGDDADNVRIDASTNRVFIGYGKGALAVIDAPSHRKVADLPLKAHPESFQLDPTRGRAFVNVPDAGHVAVVTSPQQDSLPRGRCPAWAPTFPWRSTMTAARCSSPSAGRQD